MPQQFTSVCFQNSFFLCLAAAEGEKHKEGIWVSFILVINSSKTAVYLEDIWDGALRSEARYKY